MPMIMDTLFDTYDFSGVTIVPFNTHAGSGDGGTYSDIKELEPNATAGRPSSLSTPMPEAVTGALTVISKNWNRMQPFWKGLRFAGRMPEKTAQRKQCFHGWRDWTWNDVLRAR